MQRLVLPEDPDERGELTLSGRRFHHLCRVRRHRVGDRLEAIDSAGRLYECVLAEVESSWCRVRVIRRDHATAAQCATEVPAGARLELVQFLPKGRAIDTIVRQATECGVAAVFAVSGERSVVRFRDGDREKKESRWARIAAEAVQQSGAPVLPTVQAVEALDALPSVPNEGLGLAFDADPLAGMPLHKYLDSVPNTVRLVIGPEGGFSPKERDTLARSGYGLVHLGTPVLRTDTAAVYAIAAVQAVARERQAWRGKEASRE